MYSKKELDRIEADLPNINKSRTTEIVLQSLINSCRRLYRLLDKRHKKNIFVVTQLDKRKGLAPVEFEVLYMDKEEIQVLPVTSPSWNFQDAIEFYQSAVATAFCCYAKTQGYKVTIEKETQMNLLTVNPERDTVHCANCLEQVSDDISSISDGYHTFSELYEHRIALFIALMYCNPEASWWSRKHNDGTMFENYIIAGINLPTGMITYHFKDTYIEYLTNAEIKEIEFAPEWDGHTAKDVVKRLLDATQQHH